MLTVSIIEDDELYRQVLIHSIRSAKTLQLLDQYSTAEMALEQLPNRKPDVVLMDIKLPRMNGIECLRRLREIVPSLTTHFLMLTGFEDVDLIFDSFKAGAHGYLVKTGSIAKKLPSFIKDVVNGGAPMSPAVARKLITHFERHPRPQPQLTNQKERVLLQLSEGLMYKEMAEKLSVSMDTVRFHLKSIYSKLHVHSRAAAVRLYHEEQTHFNPPKMWNNGR